VQAALAEGRDATLRAVSAALSGAKRSH